MIFATAFAWRGPGAAVGDERELTGIVSALDGHEAKRAGHVLVHDREDPLGGRLDRRKAHRVCHGLHGGPGGIDVELHLAAQQARRKVPEDDVRVRHGWLGSALAVGRRPGVCPGGLRADPKRLRELGDVRDRAAAGSDGVDVHGGHLDPEVADRGLAPDGRLAVLAERHVGRRPTHVEGEDVVEARLPGDEQPTGDAA